MFQNKLGQTLETILRKMAALDLFWRRRSNNYFRRRNGLLVRSVFYRRFERHGFVRAKERSLYFDERNKNCSKTLKNGRQSFFSPCVECTFAVLVPRASYCFRITTHTRAYTSIVIIHTYRKPLLACYDNSRTVRCYRIRLKHLCCFTFFLLFLRRSSSRNDV